MKPPHSYQASLTVKPPRSLVCSIPPNPTVSKFSTICRRELRDQAEEGQLPAFQYIEINGQRLPEPASLYSVLLQVRLLSHRSL